MYLLCRKWWLLCSVCRFFEEFHASRDSNLAHFYRSYLPPITPEHYTCVGLALELLRRLSNLETKFPGLTSRLYLSSCEEVCTSTSTLCGILYVILNWNAQKIIKFVSISPYLVALLWISFRWIVSWTINSYCYRA